MKTGKLLTLFAFCQLATTASADIVLKATYIEKGVEVEKTEDFTANAPLYVEFTSNPSDLDTGATIEWHISNTSAGINITRYEENTSYTFTVAGKHVITLNVVQDGDILESKSISITISDSHLEMPNAFSPNGDGINDYFQAKTNSKSIVEFHAYIFNRHGQKLYDWTDWQDEKSGWDGTHNGHPVKDGVYFVYVKALGADGTEYNIRRDVNLLRNFNTVDSTNP
ncbi:MAG: gliding motility-associated C-terminal domain-containing protein [Prevotella sp.]|jgi:gliding motility-associated-like protein|nr:gliding motility-associated C-terminal domain-containing protein [Prevotella sp.]